MTDELDFDAHPPRGRTDGRRRGRWGGPRKSAKGAVGVLTMVPPPVRRAARRKLLDSHGVTLPRSAGLAAIARAVAVTLALPVPKDFAGSSKLVLGFVGRKEVVAPCGPIAVESPFVPLRISPEMERALARTRAAREAGSTSNGSSNPGEINPEVVASPKT